MSEIVAALQPDLSVAGRVLGDSKTVLSTGQSPGRLQASAPSRDVLAL